jgi:predicted CXXCH cytochrome family protein
MRITKLVLFLAVMVVLAAMLSWAKAPKSAIVNSAHDLRSRFNAAPFTVCSFCHIAHKFGDAPAGPGPLLWNHTMSSVASYGVYQSQSFNGLNTDIADLGGQNTVSNLCLSCHDGTVAVNSFYEAVTGANFQPIPQNTTFMPQSHRVRDLTKQHPVNFSYTALLATKAGMLVPSSANSVDAAGEIPLFQGKMQCATCHDPHNGTSSIFVQAFPTQTSGSFCTYCHL